MIKTKIEVIAENLITIHPLLYKSISKPMRNISSITPGGMFVMGSLKRHGILSMTDIGKCLAMPKPHITGIVDKLIEKGYVARTNDPNDRRIINISLTKKGLTNFEKIKMASTESLKDKLLLLSEEELEQLSVASQQVKDILISILSKQ
ncbi:MarR family winged helix-turn-helix transcriptional regulator [Williamwhitmania taraxaci]|uniref:DNA-binding transcriptional regulator, MarR family n=1 Tax=Williamwhitmania taraxaci TaxID=1640674 RepID=A0A1G6MI93_9BACT|nr:MarR family transcriptional regulator [Williamwhitmania taraxaci]SDC55252.1 DNA-binding transcriptional regulator, MarR family [Williamwhitmania taraxaci]